MKLRRRFNWDELFEGKAWFAHELAEKVGISPTAMRRYLRIYCAFGKLCRVKYGRFWIYYLRKDMEEFEKHHGTGIIQSDKIEEV